MLTNSINTTFLVAALVICLASIAACTVDPAREAAYYGAPEQAVAQCKFEAMQRSGVAWPDEVALCLKGKGY